ncbi:MAG: c-type cytochrome [Sphingobacteriales bacterium]|nr:MAG: c-type cytochrome [Sphingobacteriales bacterium]
MFTLFSCREDDNLIPDMDETPYQLVIPVGFPPMPIPDDNLMTKARVNLGRKLFYDPVLSVDSTISCASCHQQHLAFSDDRPLSKGVAGRLGFRNSPTLTNVGYLPFLLKEGGVETLEIQALTPITEHAEMDFTIGEAAKRLQSNPKYVQLSYLAYGQSPSPFTITRALAAFQRTLISGNASADNPQFLSPEAAAGKQIFFGEKAKCGHCHSGFNFTSNGFENNGLYESYADEGRFRLTLDPNDIGVFKIPTLRNIALTAPYMHDGSLLTLSEVIDHYQSGGTSHPNKSPLIQPFELNEKERLDLLAFLESLTDSVFIANPKFKPD